MPDFNLMATDGSAYVMAATEDNPPLITFQKKSDDVPSPTQTVCRLDANRANGVVGLVANVDPPANGTISFYRDSAFIGGDIVSDVAGEEYATRTDPQTTPGTYVYIAEFNPDDASKYTRSSSAPQTVVVPPVPVQLVIPDGANTVTLRIGSQDFNWPLAAVDPGERNAYPGERGPNELILYSSKNGRTSTGTNKYGYEVPIGPDGVVLTGGGVNATIPSGGYVLSGHDNGTSDSSAAFVKSLHVGDKIIVKKLTVIPPVIDPTPIISGGFPKRVISGYWQQWVGPDLLTVLNNAPGYNVMWAAFAFGMAGQNFDFSPRTYSSYAGTNGESLFKQHMQQWQKQGKVCGISFGGGVPAKSATLIRTDAEAENAYNKMVPIIEKYGFTAVDCDMENGPEGFTYEGLSGFYRRLRKTYGEEFGLSITPRPYEDFYYDIGGRLYFEGLLDLCQHQFYDAEATKDLNFLKGWIPERVENAKGRGIPVSIQVPGTIIWSGYPNGWNTVDNYLNIIKGIKGIRGAMTWEFGLDQRMGWPFASKMASGLPVPA